MSNGGWSCPHSIDGICDIIKKQCHPGAKGCVLYSKALFSDETPSSNKDSFEKKMEIKLKKIMQERQKRDKF